MKVSNQFMKGQDVVDVSGVVGRVVKSNYDHQEHRHQHVDVKRVDGVVNCEDDDFFIYDADNLSSLPGAIISHMGLIRERFIRNNKVKEDHDSLWGSVVRSTSLSVIDGICKELTVFLTGKETTSTPAS